MKAIQTASGSPNSEFAGLDRVLDDLRANFLARGVDRAWVAVPELARAVAADSDELGSALQRIDLLGVDRC